MTNELFASIAVSLVSAAAVTGAMLWRVGHLERTDEKQATDIDDLKQRMTKAESHMHALGNNVQASETRNAIDNERLRATIERMSDQLSHLVTMIARIQTKISGDTGDVDVAALRRQKQDR